MDAALSMHANKYVHRDIRWPNITYDPKSDKYLLIDFEQIGRLCDSNCDEHDENDFCTPAIYDAAFIIRLFNLNITYDVQYDEYYKFAANLDISGNLNKTEINRIKNLFWTFYKKNSKLLFLLS